MFRWHRARLRLWRRVVSRFNSRLNVKPEGEIMRRHMFAVVAVAACRWPPSSPPRSRRRRCRRAAARRAPPSTGVELLSLDRTRRCLHGLLPVRLRRLDGGQSDARRSAALGPLQSAAGRQLRHPPADPRSAGRRRGSAKGRRLLRRLHGRETASRRRGSRRSRRIWRASPR